MRGWNIASLLSVRRCRVENSQARKNIFFLSTCVHKEPKIFGQLSRNKRFWCAVNYLFHRQKIAKIGKVLNYQNFQDLVLTWNVEISQELWIAFQEIVFVLLLVCFALQSIQSSISTNCTEKSWNESFKSEIYRRITNDPLI